MAKLDQAGLGAQRTAPFTRPSSIAGARQKSNMTRRQMSEQAGLRVAIMRGGTSKAVFVRADEWPARAGPDSDELVRAVFGSPDRRQIDGLGGADLLTSKFASDRAADMRGR